MKKDWKYWRRLKDIEMRKDRYNEWKDEDDRVCFIDLYIEKMWMKESLK